MTTPRTDALPFLPFALPDIGEAEIAEVVDTLRSGWVTTGPKAKRFERDFADFLARGVTVPADGGGGNGRHLGGNDAGGDAARGADESGEQPGGAGAGADPRRLHALAVNSATAGLHLALEAVGVGPGDEVITTTHTFTASAEVARYLGADVVLVDIDPATLCIDPAAVQAAITPRTKAIVPVHYGGRAADMPALLAIAARHGLHVVEDAAHALPTTCGGRLVGTLGSAATVFSFYANKTITTGEGGMVVTRDERIAKRIGVMRLHGMSRDAFDRFNTTVPAWYYEIVAPGYKYNLTDIAAALGIQQLKRTHDFQRRRADIAAQYDAAFAGLPLRLPPQPAAGDLHAWHLYPLRLADDAPVGARDALIERLFAAGIGCSVHYIPLHLQPYWRDRYRLQPAQFPHSQHAYERSLSLPLYTRMTDGDVRRVVGAVTAALGA